ncbi:MAG: type IV toxin-antitoxin system AbiEi family antitoxin domain-containing protein [Gammaproteobacteria bacterium]|nr:type IV toxin-antitoxin system AbiEi family antitoxin domain-containing protein [Gammaproteobacteria bacterium]
MTIQIRQKTRNLLANWRQNTLASAAWLQTQSISRPLINYYLKSGWLKKAGHGVYSRLDDKIEWPGVVYALQQDFPGTYHIGGITALEFEGLAHFIPMRSQPFLFLFTEHPHYSKTTPKWFKDAIKNKASFLVVSKKLFLTREIGLEIKEFQTIPLLIASPERAILELLAIALQKDTISNAEYIMQNMGQLRHRLMQQLLEDCTHKAAKRLFLHFSEKYDLPVMKSINVSKIDLGTGRIHLEKGAHYDSKYKISIPEEIEEDIPDV